MGKKVKKRKQYRGAAKWFEYLLARGFISCLQRVPIGMSYRLGRGVGWLSWKLLKRRRCTVEKNLRIIYKHLEAQSQLPELSLHDGVRETFMRIGANLLCGFSFKRLSEAKIQDHLIVEGVDVLDTALSQQKGVIAVLSHMGPWEALAHLNRFSTLYGINAPFGAIYRRFNNDYLDDWFVGEREALGTRLFESRHKFYGPADFVRNGGILGVLSDQRASGGEAIEFFGHAVNGTPLPGLLHLRTKAPWLAVSLSTVGFCRWRMRFIPMSQLNDGDATNRKTLAVHCGDAVETALSESIYDGFWFHNRFR